VSLEHLATQHKPSRLTGAFRTPTSSSLFYSPTAGAGGGIHTASNRSSSFLPAGYYPSGSAAAAAGAPTANLGGPPAAGYGRASGENLSMSGQGRERDSRVVGRERKGVTHAGARESTLSLGVSPQGRTPSAYMEDLFENHGNGMRERH